MKSLSIFVLGLFLGAGAGAYGMNSHWNSRVEEALKKAGYQRVERFEKVNVKP